MFNLKRIENGRMNVPEPSVFEATESEAIVYGEALALTAGKLTKCGATAKPTFVAMQDVTADATDRKIQVARVESNQLYEVAVSAVPTALKVGEKVTLDADGLRVTATTASGVAEIVDLNGATVAGDKITVRF